MSSSGRQAAGLIVSAGAAGRRAAGAPGSEEDAQAEQSYFERFKEWLLPTGSFARSQTPRSDLIFARIVTFIFWIVLTGFLVYTIARLLISGRIELFTSSYKVDFVEAPSLAFCPFSPNETVQWPLGAEPWASADKMDFEGVSDLGVTPRNCTFDRNCACVDMYAFKLQDVTPKKVEGVLKSVQRQTIEMRTNFSDPSPERVLKVGIYDSYDKAPDWFYINQGALLICQLELTIWSVIDVSFNGLVETLKGDWRAMVRNKHIYRYTSQQVGDARLHQPWRETAIRYEMKTFFVDETMSSQRAFSLYTIAVIFVLIALRYVVVDAFMSTFFPEWQEKSDEPVVREFSGVAACLKTLFASCLPAEGEASERDPLLTPKSATP